MVGRLLPYWYDAIVPDLAAGRTVLVVAHGNSIRALVKHLDGIGDAEIAELDIPTGMPLVYELTDGFRPRTPGGRYLDPQAAAAARRPSRTRADEFAEVRRHGFPRSCRQATAGVAIGYRKSELLANNAVSGNSARCAGAGRALPSKCGYGGDYGLGRCSP